MTDRQTTCDRNTALCTKVHRAVIIIMNDFGRVITVNCGEAREICFSYQLISVFIQRYNAVLLHDGLPALLLNLGIIFTDGQKIMRIMVIIVDVIR